jgi:membrane protease YdiL (CAAX protease family)
VSSPISSTLPPPDRDRFAVPWSLPQTLAGFVVCFLAYLVGALLLAALLVSIAGRSFIDRHMLEFNLVAYQFLVISVVIVGIWLASERHHWDPAALGYRFPGWQTLLGTTAVVPAIFVAIYIFALVFDALAPGYHLQGNSKELLPNGSKHIALGTELLVFAWAAVEVPLTEETLFRGILFQGLRDSLVRWLPYQGAVLSAALISGMTFGILHFEIHTLPILALLGVILAYVFQVTRSIYASALVHALINAVAVYSVFQS